MDATGENVKNPNFLTRFCLSSSLECSGDPSTLHHSLIDVAWLSENHCMCDPSPSPLHDDGAHAVLVALGEEMLVGDSLGPEYLQDSSKVLGAEGGQFVEVAFRYPPAF